jgi:hypothetical protein
LRHLLLQLQEDMYLYLSLPDHVTVEPESTSQAFGADAWIDKTEAPMDLRTSPQRRTQHITQIAGLTRHFNMSESTYSGKVLELT